MADDANLARLVLAVERTGASLVLVGDHRQLAAVGPGGALTGTAPTPPRPRRHTARQHPPTRPRRTPRPRRTAPRLRRRRRRLVRGRRTYPHRTDAGRHARGDGRRLGRRHRRGSRHRPVRLATRRCGRPQPPRPRPLGPPQPAHRPRRHRHRRPHLRRRRPRRRPRPQPGRRDRHQPTTHHHRPHPDRIHAATGDGRIVTLTGTAIDREHLDYGYAVTVHRAQGATCDRAHLLAAGGGRELAYVALSRARHHTTIHATADDLSQAVEDLTGDWNLEHHQHWITDTPAHPGHQPQPEPAAACASGSRRSRRGPSPQPLPASPGARRRLPPPAHRHRTLAQHTRRRRRPPPRRRPTPTRRRPTMHRRAPDTQARPPSSVQVPRPPHGRRRNGRTAVAGRRRHPRPTRYADPSPPPATTSTSTTRKNSSPNSTTFNTPPGRSTAKLVSRCRSGRRRRASRRLCAAAGLPRRTRALFQMGPPSLA